MRMALSNGDFLEAAEYFVLEDDECITRRYRYQWMDGECRELRITITEHPLYRRSP